MKLFEMAYYNNFVIVSTYVLKYITNTN